MNMKFQYIMKVILFYSILFFSLHVIQMKAVLLLLVAISVTVVSAVRQPTISMNTIDSIPTSLIGTGYNTELVPPVTVTITETSTTTIIPIITGKKTDTSDGGSR